MAIGTYAELKTAVANWLHRTDLTSVIPDFIRLAESRIRNDVRCRAMEQTETGTLSAVTQALPTRFAEVRRVMLNNRVQNYITPEVFREIGDGQTDAYTVIGTNFVFQSSTQDYSVDYYQWFAPFSGDSDTNWLLTNAPDVYLFASIFEASEYTQGNGDKWMARYRMAVQALENAERNFGSRLVVRPDAARGYVP